MTRPIVVFTDGAAKGNPGPGGWAAIIVTPEGRVRELGGGSRHTTNNRMELTGPIEALSLLERVARATSRCIPTPPTSSAELREWIPNWHTTRLENHGRQGRP